MTEKPESFAQRVVLISAVLAVVGLSHAADPALGASRSPEDLVAGSIPILTRSEERPLSKHDAEQRRKDDALCALCPCPIEPSASASSGLVVRIVTDTSTSVLQGPLPVVEAALGKAAGSAPQNETVWGRHAKHEVQRAAAALSIPKLSGPFETCFPNGQCVVTNPAQRYSPIEQALKNEARIARRDSSTPHLVIIFTDGRESDRGSDSQCNDGPHKKVVTALRELVDTPNVHVVLFVLDGTGCPQPKQKPWLCATLDPNRCKEVDATIDPKRPDPARLRATISDVDFVLKEQVGESLAWTLRRTAPHPTLSDAVMVGSRGAFRCSGVVLDERTVLTARHCLPASHVRTSEEGQGEDGNLFAVGASAAHPDAGEDLALLRTERRMQVVPAIRRRARDGEPPTGLVRYVGFGAVDAAGLRGFGRKKIMDVAATGWGCDGARVASSGCRPGLEMVMPGSAGRDTCAGDSGGPIYELVSDGRSCFFRLIGVTSRRVADASTPCGSGGIYARVDAADVWITEQMKKWDDTDREKRR